MIARIRFRTVGVLLGAVSFPLALSGCLSSPTYGTEKTANAHLVDGLTSMVSIVPPRRSSEVAYAPRPSLVTPPDSTTLPKPQESIASEDNPQWLESPEETRERLRAEADDGDRFGTYRSPLAEQPATEEQMQQFREAKAVQKGAYEGRRFLSDPPVEYREPADTAPVDELGETEFQKEQRRKAAARKSEGGLNLGRLWPF